MGMSGSASFQRVTKPRHVLQFGLFEQHNIRIGVAADQAELAAIERPVEIDDLFRFEVSDLLSRRTVKRLEPEVIRVLVTELIDYSFAIMRKPDNPKRWDVLQVYEFRIQRRIDWNQC